MNETELDDDGAVGKMAQRLAEALVRDSMVEPWDELDMMERGALMRACEWLLMHWPEVEQARAEHMSPRTPPSPKDALERSRQEGEAMYAFAKETIRNIDRMIEEAMTVRRMTTTHLQRISDQFDRE